MAELFGREELGEAVVDGAQVGGYLFLEVAGQESERFARFDGRAHEADPFGFVPFEARDGKRDGKECLAGARRALGENDVVFGDRADQFGLGAGFRHDRDPEPVPQDGCGRELAKRPGGSGGAEQALHVACRKRVSVPCGYFQLVEHGEEPFDVGAFLFADGKSRHAREYLNTKTALQ